VLANMQLPGVTVVWLLVLSVFACLESSTMSRPIRSGQRGGLLLVAGGVLVANAWTVARLPHRRSGKTTIDMGKGFQKARNKQADLAKKMAIAKAQNQAAPCSDTGTAVPNNTKDNDNDNDSNPRKSKDTSGINGDQEGRDVFERLLRTTKGALPTGDETESAYFAPIQAGSNTKNKIAPQNFNRPKKTKKANSNSKKEEENDDLRTQTVVVEARRKHFESLIDIATTAPLGAIGAAKLVPWVPPFLKKGLIVFVDPRSNSKDLRRTMKYHASSSLSLSSGDIDIVFVTADSAGETQAWLKRNGIDLMNPPESKLTPNIQILSDPRLSFMTKYEIIGDTIDHRWSMAMLAFDTKGNLVRMERDVEPSHCSQLVSNTTKDLDTTH